ncbi:MAG: hypothetical protein R2932_60400 [Caldilineaceae bacterium]
MSEQIGELEAMEVVGDNTSAKFVAGKTFAPQIIAGIVQNHRLARWIDTRYNENMVLQPVLWL